MSRIFTMDPKTPHFNVPPARAQSRIEQAIALEREAHHFRGEGKIDQAFQAFDQAAKSFQEAHEPLRAAVCFSSAATCWNIHTGWQPLRNAATRNESAALQALEARDFGYAETLFSEAALLYEKEGDYTKFSYCYGRAKDARLQRLWRVFMRIKPSVPGAVGLAEASLKERAVAFLNWILGSLNRWVWGYGEMPFRTCGIACGVLILSALCYAVSGTVLANGFLGKIDLLDALYMSVITYTTVGFGDYLPVGWIRGVAALEALAGIVLTPLFLISLTRRYLRMR